MITNCSHHALCDYIDPPEPRPRQRTLRIINGLLCLGPPPEPPLPSLRRTPAGKAVRNIANFPAWSTTDPSLTTFLRFPPEVRLQIYDYLLVSSKTVQRRICPVKMRFIERFYQLRLRLFPTILQCCRKINEEGAAVLYGKNMFELEYYTEYFDIFITWSPALVNMLLITRLVLRYDPWTACSQDRKTLELLDMFPALREVSIRLKTIRVEDWEKFLRDTCDGLRRMKRLTLDINVYHIMDRSSGPQWRECSIAEKEIYLRTFQEIFWKQQDIWENRKVSWEFEQETDNDRRTHGDLGTLKVLID